MTGAARLDSPARLTAPLPQRKTMPRGITPDTQIPDILAPPFFHCTRSSARLESSARKKAGD